MVGRQQVGRGAVTVGWVSEDTLTAVCSLLVVVVAYLAVAISYLRERVARLEGKDERRDV